MIQDLTADTFKIRREKENFSKTQDEVGREGEVHWNRLQERQKD